MLLGNWHYLHHHVCACIDGLLQKQESRCKMQMCSCAIVQYSYTNTCFLIRLYNIFSGIANIFWAVKQKIFVKHPFAHPGIRLIPLIWTFHKYQSQHYFHITINYGSAMIKCHFVWYVSIALYKNMWYKVNFIKSIVI